MFSLFLLDDWRERIAQEIDYEDTIEALFAPFQVDDSQLELDLFDYDGEADDLAEARLDEEFWAKGQF